MKNANKKSGSGQYAVGKKQDAGCQMQDTGCQMPDRTHPATKVAPLFLEGNRLFDVATELEEVKNAFNQFQVMNSFSESESNNMGCILFMFASRFDEIVKKLYGLCKR